MGMRSVGLSKTFLLTDTGKKKKRNGEGGGGVKDPISMWFPRKNN